MLQQNLDAQQDQHHAARKLRRRLVPRAEYVANTNARRRKGKGHAANEQHGRHNIHLQKCKGDTDCERVNAGRHRKRQHGAEAKRVIQALRPGPRLLDHAAADQREQQKRDPVIDRDNHRLKPNAEHVAEQRHQRLKAAEIDANSRRMSRLHARDG